VSKRGKVVPVAQPNQTESLCPRGLRVPDAAAYAGVTHWCIRTAIWAGRLKAHRAGKVILIMRDDLDRYLNSLPEIQPSRAEWLAKRQQMAEGSNA
jgi:excisionase family DNA binding protein